MVYAYIRVSTEMQNYASQEYEIQKYCESHHITVDKWISESVSGTVRVEKRILGKTISRMRSGDLLVCTEISRLGRNMLMVMSILNLCVNRGIAIRTIKDNFNLADNLNSKIIAFTFALASEIERNLISQRTKEALMVKKLRGVRLGRPPGSSHKRDVVYDNMPKIIDALSGGATLTQIARKYNVNRNTLRKYIDDYCDA
ncbi:MAG: recombinase family protein [Bacteroidales bacterium]|nr:recombinase family protein [Bacteroidales bacterium]